MHNGGDKKGLSTVVGTLLIILLVLLATGIVWVVVRGIIQNDAEQVSLGKFTSDLEIEDIKINPTVPNYFNLTIKRKVGEGEISGLKFIIDDGENIEIVKISNLPLEELEERVINLSLTRIQNASNIQKISVAPILKLESGKEITGDIKDEYEISPDNIFEGGYTEEEPSEEIPSCTSNSECNDNNACTTDSCYRGECSNSVISGCTSCISISQCEDNDGCTIDSCSNNRCVHTRETSCAHNDNCCPVGCNFINDNNCHAVCLNGQREGTEECDGTELGGATCTSVMDSGYTGALGCSSTCKFDVSLCIAPCTCPSDGDACTTDICYNNICRHIPESNCCTSSNQCNDNNICTTNICSGNVCSYPTITSCLNSDGCCPTGCSLTNDNNCASVCGNGIREGSEGCDDGDTSSGDGCSNLCVVESGWTCNTATPNVCTQSCTPSCSGKECGPNSCNTGSCGACTNAHGSNTCSSAGLCQPSCNSGWGNCDGSRVNGCENSLTTTSNCGSCGRVCSSGQTCTNGVCTSSGSCPDTCSSEGYQCGSHNFCGTITNCGNCGGNQNCNSAWQCVVGSCDDSYMVFGHDCGYHITCGEDITNGGTCPYGMNCINHVCTPPTSCTDTCASLAYGCGTHTICGRSVDCGSCANGEICGSNNLCIAESCTNGYRDGTETGIDCGGICIDCIEQADFYVAPWGNDNNPGTFDRPWATWEKAFDLNSGVGPGDLVYFRGGVYYRTIDIVYLHLHGNPGAPIRFFAYPGERPIWDGSLLPTSTNSFYERYLLILERSDEGAPLTSNLHFKGLEMRNFGDIRGGYTSGILVMGGDNIIFEELSLHNNAGDQIMISPPEDSTNVGRISIINCDFYNNFDMYNPVTGGLPPGVTYVGGASRGFSLASRNPNSYYYVDGCRSWMNSDGGFSLATNGITIINHTWVFLNGYGWGDGDGWKGTWTSASGGNTGVFNDVRKTFVNIISAGNRMGFYDNNEITRWQIYNSFVYHNARQEYDLAFSGGIYFCYGNPPLEHIFRNNIEYDNGFYTGGSEPNCFASSIIHSHNTWDSSVTVNDNDFVSLDITELMRPRKANGDLPDVNFGHLRAGSDLINRGTNVGLPYSGSAPDLGAFEYA